MTRINLVEPSQLSDKHLTAEYRELPRIFTLVMRQQEQHNYNPITLGIPAQYTLGKGHVKFFYNKIGWLLERYEKLYVELQNRNYNLDCELYSSVVKEARKLRLIFFRPYTPKPEEIYLNMARLCKRSKMERVLDELRSE